MSDPQTPSRPDADGPATVKAVLLSEAVATLEPLIRLWIANGIGFTEIARALRAGFVDVAEKELEAGGRKSTDAAVSLLSGVHRKEVKSHRASREGSRDEAPGERELSYAEQVFTRWGTDAAYRDAEGKPMALPLGGVAPSFEALVASVTRDFSKRTVLDELVRLGLVREEGETVVPQAEAMVPKRGMLDLARYLQEHLHDHMAAGVANLQAIGRDAKAPYLEHSMYVNGISDSSIEMLSNLARNYWKQAFDAAVNAAQQRYEVDRQHDHQGRLRFGVYVYSESNKRVSP